MVSPVILAALVASRAAHMAHSMNCEKDTIINSVGSTSDSLSTGWGVPQSKFNTGYCVAEKEVPWEEQQKRLKEVMPW